MTLKDLDLKTSYDSDEDDILNDFYIPVLSESVKYKRLAGYFTSTSLAIAAKGIAKFISNGGKIELIANVVLSEEDFKKIKEFNGDQLPKEVEESFLEDLNQLEDNLIKDHVKMLGWMLKNKKLEIKIAIVKKGSGIQHQKTGILEDKEGNLFSFSGSDNETKGGWIDNTEEFKVFKSWRVGQREYLQKDVDRFDKLWEDRAQRLKIYSVSEAISKKLIEIAPKSNKEFENLSENTTKKLLGKGDGVLEEVKKDGVKELRYYQEEALLAWFKNKNRGFFEMATGTGKTLAAIHCAKRLIKEKRDLGVIIAVPSNPLVEQWEGESRDAGFNDSSIIRCSSNYNWKNTFTRYALLNNPLNKIFIFTYQSLCTPEVQEIISNSTRNFLIICDEMHHAGAPTYSKCLNEDIEYRLGLSATPIRKYDIEGNELLAKYFGEEPTLIFDLKRALKEVNPQTGKTYLCPYDYNFETVELNDEEHKSYRKLSRQIAMQKQSAPDEDGGGQADKIRALLVSCAAEKLNALTPIIRDIKKRGQNKKMLFYCQNFKPKKDGEYQIEGVKKILDKNNLNCLEFTSKFDDPIYRKDILNALKTDAVDGIVSMKCLDEGVDLPDIRTAIILASSSNSAQFIQRRGRILRTSPGKTKAEIYDFIVGPPSDIELKKSDISLIRREFERAKEYSGYAINSKKIKKDLYNWLNRYGLSEEDLYDEEQEA